MREKYQGIRVNIVFPISYINLNLIFMHTYEISTRTCSYVNQRFTYDIEILISEDLAICIISIIYLSDRKNTQIRPLLILILMQIQDPNIFSMFWGYSQNASTTTLFKHETSELITKGINHDFQKHQRYVLSSSNQINKGLLTTTKSVNYSVQPNNLIVR